MRFVAATEPGFVWSDERDDGEKERKKEGEKERGEEGRREQVNNDETIFTLRRFTIIRIFIYLCQHHGSF